MVIRADVVHRPRCAKRSNAASSCSTARWARWSRGSGSRRGGRGAASGSAITRMSVKGCIDLLALTRPEAIEDIHLEFLRAGADIVETDTFTATSIALADYGLEGAVRDINLAAARVARRAAERAERDDGRPRWVAGSIGPTTKTASLSPDVNDPGARAVTFRQLVDAFAEQARALIEGGVDLLLTETHIDTLNCKASLFAIAELFDARRAPRAGDRARSRSPIARAARCRARPSRRSTTRSPTPSCSRSASTARSAPTTCGRTSPSSPRIAGMPVACYPNAGLPNEFGGYDDTPEHMAKRARRRSRARACSTSSAAAAAPGPSTSRRSAPRSTASRRAGSRRPPRYMRLAGPRAAHDHAARRQLRRDRRAHQRHRLGRVPPADQGRQATTRRSRSRASRSRAAPTSSTSAWTRACSTASPRCGGSST